MALNEIWKIFGYIGKMNVINTYYFIINQDNRFHIEDGVHKYHLEFRTDFHCNFIDDDARVTD
jgi:hypothetical protein